MHIDKPWLDEYPPGVPHVLPADNYVSVTQLLDERVRRFAARLHTRYMGHDFRYADTDREARNLAAFMQQRGIGRGMRVAIMLPNCQQYAIAVLAVFRVGAIVVNVNPFYTPRELRLQLQDSESVAILARQSCAQILAAVVAETALRLILMTDETDLLPVVKRIAAQVLMRRIKSAVPFRALPGSVSLRQALRQGRAMPLEVVTSARDDVAILQYTGGTTGVPKGAMLTHGNVIAAIRTVEAWLSPLIERPPRLRQAHVLLALPIHHIYGFVNGLLCTTALGGLVVLVPNGRDIPALIRIWRAQPIHIFSGINTLYHAILAAPAAGRIDFSALRLSAAGGAPTHAGVAERWQQLSGRTIHEGFGLSETCSGIASNPWHLQAFSATAGVPLPGMDVCVLDEAGERVRPGVPGELCVRGPMVMAGYWKRPKETALAIGEDGFLRTGDIGFLTERGHLRIVDRKKDMILVSGFNVFPNEIEAVISAHPAVLECAVVGLPDRVTGEAVCAVIVPRGHPFDASALEDWCRRELTNYKRPSRIVVQGHLPKTPVGKILRRELRDSLRPEQVN